MIVFSLLLLLPPLASGFAPPSGARPGTGLAVKEAKRACCAEKASSPAPPSAPPSVFLRYPSHVAVIEDISPIAQKMVDEVLLETGSGSWQASDFLPDLSTKNENWAEDIKAVRDMAAGVSDELLVVLIGDMVTEEALPTYQTLLNTFEGCDDPDGDSDTPWARWSRGWTSEENRHGDLLNRYLYLSGRCDMRKVEETIQHLITNGFNPGAKSDPYRGFVYTSFQERATKISHGNVGKLAKECGDVNLQRICAKIAGDEGRHEKAYQAFCTEILERDPVGFIETFADQMRGSISMPAECIYDGHDRNLYASFSEVAQKLGVYTAVDYAEITGHLIKTWDLENLAVPAAAEKDRDFLCKLPGRYEKLAMRSMKSTAGLSDKASGANTAGTDAKVPLKEKFAWLHQD